jgi:hypothetical protein
MEMSEDDINQSAPQPPPNNDNATLAEEHEEEHAEEHAEEHDDLATKQLELEELAAQATASLNEALSAINKVTIASEPRTPLPPVLGTPFHPRTGKVRKPRNQDSSDDEIFKVESSSDEDCHMSEMECEGDEGRASPEAVPKASTGKRGRPPTAKTSPADTRWISTANGRYGTNKPKCPPCARLKKKDPCNGPPPCRQCFGKGRRTAELCQEWGETYVPKVRKRRCRKTGIIKTVVY